MPDAQIQKKRFPVAKVFCIVGFLFCVLAHGFSPLILTAYTVYPFTFSAALGLIFCLWCYRKSARGRWLWPLLWFTAWCWLADEAQMASPLNSSKFTGLKIVSLNCAGGSVEAAAEALQEDPDIILLQESPSKPELERLFQGKYHGVWGLDASIWTKEKLRALPIPKGTSNYVLGETDSGTIICSLRLAPPVLRFDYWNPECWQEYAEARIRRKQELDQIVGALPKPRRGKLIIIGGDFNTPSDPYVQMDLEKIVDDSYRMGGMGWGKTAVNPWPFVRIDQIWLNRAEVTNYVKETRNSDHCMVVTFIWGSD